VLERKKRICFATINWAPGKTIGGDWGVGEGVKYVLMFMGYFGGARFISD